MTLKDLLQTAKESFRLYVNLAKDDPLGSFYWNGCLCGIRRMTINSINRLDGTVSKDEADEAYDALDEAYDQARKEIDHIYKKAVNSND